MRSRNVLLTMNCLIGGLGWSSPKLFLAWTAKLLLILQLPFTAGALLLPLQQKPGKVLQLFPRACVKHLVKAQDLRRRIKWASRAAVQKIVLVDVKVPRNDEEIVASRPRLDPPKPRIDAVVWDVGGAAQTLPIDASVIDLLL